MPYVELGNRLYVGPNYIDLGAPDGRIWEARFDLMPLSDGSNSTLLRSYLAACGLTLTRASSATVQTSASTVVTSGIGVDDPRVGDAGYGRGLVIEESRTNSCDMSSPWTWGATGASKTQVTGPDGVAASATRIEDTDPATFGFVARSIAYTAGTQYVATCWINAEQSAPAGENLSFNTNDGASINPIARASVLGTWSRKANATYVSGAGPSSNFSIVPVYSTVAGLGAASFFGVQRENGKFPTELIVTAGAAATRQTDLLTANDPARLIRGGRLSMECRFVPKGNSADHTGSPYVWWSDAGNNYAYWNATLGKFLVIIGGATAITSNAFSWSAGDVVDLWVEAGSGSTTIKARRNGGAVSDLGTDSTIRGAITGANLSLMGRGGAVLTSWVQQMRAYAPGRRPQWAA